MRVPPRKRLDRRRRPLAMTAAAVVVLLFLLGGWSSFYTELLWFRETGFSKVFVTQLWVRLGLGAVFGAAFAALLLLNLWIVQRITNPSRLFSVSDQILERYRATMQPYTKWIVAGTAIVFGLFAGSGASVQWREWLLFNNAVDFGATDPIFGKDIGFYVFRLPFHRFLFTWLFSTLIVVTLVAGFAHYFMGGIRPQVRGERVSPEVRAHLSVLLGLIVLLKAWGYRLDQFELLYSPRGTVTGASYTDVNAQLPALRLLVVIALVVAVFFLVNARARNWILPLGGIALLALTSIIAGGIYPAIVQRFQVTPNEQAREAPYIERNIDATRRSFGLEKVEERSLSGTAELTSRALRRNVSTIENIRLWSPQVLVENYISVQRIKQYYEFVDADVDRYTFADGRRQVMLSAREVSPADLEQGAQTWLNTHLVYTHGYGVVASRVDRATDEGEPALIIRDIPPRSAVGGPEIRQPRIYFGENEETSFVVVNSREQELDYPQEPAPKTNRYEGTGGIQLKGLLRRIAFAWRFRDTNLMISGAITPDSRILFRRRIAERVRSVAPFLRFDADPYVAIVEGRIVWIVDAYTTTDMFPYAQRLDLGAVTERFLQGRANYIRNSVKVVVDAEHGTVRAYAWDENDPLLKAWRKAFPGIFRSRAEMSAGLLEHVRYPEGLFRVQTDRYATYHIEQPAEFYRKEDAWAVANDPTGSTAVGDFPIEPYYVLMRLPGEEKASFSLVRPFTPNGRQNLTAYMVAHSDVDPDDPSAYGGLVTYEFSRAEQVLGPEQVESRMLSDPDVSPFVTLNNQQGSRVTHGNLLIIPIEESLLYVQPLYVTGQGSRLPQLKRVIVMSGERVEMAPTLRGALSALFGEEPEEPVGGPETPAETVADLLARAIEHDRKAQEALRNGDFAEYGRQDRLRREATQKAAELAGAPVGSPSPSPSPGAG